MSLLQRKFFVVANKVLGPKLYKTPQTVNKYQKLYPDLTVERFETESQALSRLMTLESEYRLQKQRDRNIRQSEKELERDRMRFHDASYEDFVKDNEPVKDKTEPISKEEKKVNIETTPTENKATAQETQTKQEEDLDPKKENNSIFYFFKENEERLKKAREKIDPNKTYHIFFDGSSKFNPGPNKKAGSGYAIFTDQSQKIYFNSVFVGLKTNNQAEYLGLIYGMRSALNLGIKLAHVYGDSEIVIKQMLGRYAVKSKSIYSYYGQAAKMMKEFKSIEFTGIPRKDNASANKLAEEGRKIKKKS